MSSGRLACQAALAPLRLLVAQGQASVSTRPYTPEGERPWKEHLERLRINGLAEGHNLAGVIVHAGCPAIAAHESVSTSGAGGIDGRVCQPTTFPEDDSPVHQGNVIPAKDVSLLAGRDEQPVTMQLNASS